MPTTFTQRTTAASTPSSAVSPASAFRPRATVKVVTREASPTARIVRSANAIVPVAR